MEAAPERPARADEQEDAADGDDRVVHVQRRRRVRGREDEEHADEDGELGAARGVSFHVISRRGEGTHEEARDVDRPRPLAEGEGATLGQTEGRGLGTEGPALVWRLTTSRARTRE